MFKFRSYNVKKATEQNEKHQPSSASKTPSYSAMTLKKPPKKEKKKASPNEITTVANKQSPEYRRKSSSASTSSTSSTSSKWQTNKTYSPKSKNETEKKENQSVNLHKKLTRT